MLLNFLNLVEKYNMNIRGVIHIGAHYGEEVKDYIDLKINNLSFFEPLSNTLQILEDNLSNYADKAHIQIFPYALGNEEKDVEMYVSDHGGMCSSILKPKIVLEQYPGIKFPKKETVKMIRLDDVEIDIADYNFINIDVQGYELEVLRGAEHTLKNIDYVYTEINVEEVYENAPHVDELDQFLLTYGFTRVETDLSGITWGDALYIKTNED
jgi:FkbM family methyltransferase